MDQDPIYLQHQIQEEKSDLRTWEPVGPALNTSRSIYKYWEDFKVIKAINCIIVLHNIGKQVITTDLAISLYHWKLEKESMERWIATKTYLKNISEIEKGSVKCK